MRRIQRQHLTNQVHENKVRQLTREIDDIKKDIKIA